MVTIIIQLIKKINENVTMELVNRKKILMAFVTKEVEMQHELLFEWERKIKGRKIYIHKIVHSSQMKKRI